MSKIITFFVMLFVFQTASALEIGESMSLETTLALGKRIESGWKVLSPVTRTLGDLQARSNCIVSRVGMIHCELYYNPQIVGGVKVTDIEYNHINWVSADMSYLDGLAGEVVYSLTFRQLAINRTPAK